MNPWTVCLLMLLAFAGWTVLCNCLRAKVRIAVNVILFCVSAAIILHATLLSRTPGTYAAVLTPFAALAAARQQPELYREMLMNVFLFFPLGLTMSNALPRKWHRWLRIALTALTSCVLSAGIEYAQYRFALGMAETDDVICNTLGAFVGASSLLLAHAMEKHKERPTTMTLTATETQFLHIAKTAVSGGELPTEAVDWPAIFTLANQQKLLPILFEAVRKTPAAGENAPLFAAIKQQVIGQVLNQTFVTIGERIHCIAPSVRKAMDERDPEPILKRAAEQIAAGATYLDVNIGPAEKDGPERMMWAVKLLQENFNNVPLALDTANKRAIEAGIKVYNRTNGKPIVNSAVPVPKIRRYSDIFMPHFFAFLRMVFFSVL